MKAIIWLFHPTTIEHIMLTGLGFRNDKFRIPLLMFADDGLLLAHSVGDMRSLIRSVCLLYTSPSPRDKRQSRMPSSA